MSESDKFFIVSYLENYGWMSALQSMKYHIYVASIAVVGGVAQFEKKYEQGVGIHDENNGIASALCQ